MFKSYSQARDWLEGFIPQVWGKEELGLARIEYLLEKLGNPQNKFKSIHVAGTSGKGSTAYYIARLLQSFNFQETTLRRAQGRIFKIGLHISPHLNYIGERMQINGEPIPVKKLIKLIELIKPVVEKIQLEKPGLTPSYFEILVAASFIYFADEKVDWAVVEVGLGGRLDATNVLMPEVSVITNIGLDHTEILGNTIEEIAAEKAGIIKPGVPVVTAAKGKALEVIKKVAKEKGAKVISISNIQYPTSNIRYCIQETAALAITVARLTLTGKTRWLLNPAQPEKDDFLSQDAIQQAFSVGFPGRFEEIEPGVILDGAHNPDKIRALIKVVKGSFLSPRQDGTLNVILVLAFKKGKNWQEMIDILVNDLHPKSVYCTMFNSVTDTGKGSAVNPAEIVDYLRIKYHVTSIKCENSQEAVFDSIHNTKYQIPNTLVIVTGSLYLVGEVRAMWKLPQI